jgi:putative zinc finger/helix-turn-helix YgiT family protein
MSAKLKIRCPECGEGYLTSKIVDHTVSLQDGLEITVPKVSVRICDHCGETSISLKTAKQIEAYIAAQNDELTLMQLEMAREKFGVDQSEMSEILGLGDKTYHRWEKGNQIPSRSMGYYLRILVKFPQTFQWLKDRGWKNECMSRVNLKEQFGELYPSLDRLNPNFKETILTNRDFTRRNIVKIFAEMSF